MTQAEIWLLAVGLAMDCFTVSVASGIIQRRWSGKTVFPMALAFGFMQGFMPLLGWLGTRYLRGTIEAYDHWVAFTLLAFLGGKMIVEYFKEDKDEPHHFDPTSPKVVLTLSIATSIDALAVGISFACIGLTEWSEMLSPIAIIALVSFLLSLAGYAAGVSCGKHSRLPAEPLGGLILIAIGCRILYEHLIG